ncbi:metallophosphoesterase [Candidatus Omnitrophota bacterium]
MNINIIRKKSIIRALALVLVPVFLSANLSWADTNISVSTLQVQSGFNPEGDYLRSIKTMVELPLEYILRQIDIGEFDHRLTPMIRENIKLVIDFEKKYQETWDEENLDRFKWVIPVSVVDTKNKYSRDFEAQVYPGGQIELRRPSAVSRESASVLEIAERILEAEDEDKSPTFTGMIPLSNGKTASLTLTYGDLEKDSPLARKWRKLAEDDKYLYTQQVGSGPVYIGVAGDDQKLVSEFAKELLCTALLWKQSIKHELLFVLEDGDVKVYMNYKETFFERISHLRARIWRQTVKSTARLLRISLEDRDPTGFEEEEYLKGKDLFQKSLERWAKRVLVIAEEGARKLAEDKKAQENSWDLLENVPFFKNIFPSSPALDALSFSAGKMDSGSFLAVYGMITQVEADALVKELALYREEALSGLGHVLVRVERNRIFVETENPDFAAKQKVIRFVDGFCTIVNFSDSHIADKSEVDDFGSKKERELMEILDRVIENRSLLVINGDFMELWQAKYGNIKRSYKPLFEKIKKVRRVIYVAGNHDGAVLSYNAARVHIKTITVAKMNRIKNEKLEERLGELMSSPYILKRHGKYLSGKNIVLSWGFQRRLLVADKDTLYVDASILSHAKKHGKYVTMAFLDKLIEDVQENLHDEVVKDLDVEIVRYYMDLYRGFYFEHGHYADPANYQSHLGNFIASTIGVIERVFKWESAEVDLNKALSKTVLFIGKFYPKILVVDTKNYIERVLVLGKMLRWYSKEIGLEEGKTTVIFGHTHVPVHIGTGPVNPFSLYFNKVLYGNSGCWFAWSIDQATDKKEERKDWFKVSWDNVAYLRYGFSSFGTMAKRLLPRPTNKISFYNAKRLLPDAEDESSEEAAQEASEPSRAPKKELESSRPEEPRVIPSSATRESTFGEQLEDPESLAHSFIGKILSIAATKKVVLSFDDKLAGTYSEKVLDIVLELEKLKKDPRYAGILKNVTVIKAPPKRLELRLKEHMADEKTMVFMFARKTERDVLKGLESKVNTIYIDESTKKDLLFSKDSYYPLLEVVTITLARVLGSVSDEDIEGILERINIESINEEGGALVFKLLPKASEVDPQALIQSYAALKRFLKAA